MITGLLLAFAIFIVICFLNPFYLEYLVWFWNGGSLRALEYAGVSSFAEFYGLEKEVIASEAITVRKGTCIVTDSVEDGVFDREQIIFQYIAEMDANEVSLDARNHYSLRQMHFFEEKGQFFPYQEYGFTRFDLGLCKFLMYLRLCWHQATCLPIKASLIIPKGMRVLDLSLLKDFSVGSEVVASIGSPETLNHYAKARDCRVVPVKIYVS